MYSLLTAVSGDLRAGVAYPSHFVGPTVGPRVRVLGRIEVEVPHRGVVPLPDQLCGVLAALALAREPVDKACLARSVLFISPRTIDSRLSRLRRSIGLDMPLHRVPAARSGRIELDRTRVSVDADDFLDRVERARSALHSSDHDTAARLVREADELWQGEPFLAATSPGADDNPVATAIRHLHDRRSTMCSTAASLMLAGAMPLDLERLETWCRDHPHLDLVWFARVVGSLDSAGVGDARTVLDEWTATARPSRTLEWAKRLVARGRRVTPAGESSAETAARLPPKPVTREAAADRLTTWLAGVERGNASIRVITGPSGTGKTHLLDFVVGVARRRGFRILAADAEESASTHDLVRRILLPLWEAVLRDPQPPAPIAVRADDLESLLGDTPRRVSPRERDPVDAVQDVAQLATLLLRYALDTSPVLVAIDNIHLAWPQLDSLLAAIGGSDWSRLGVIVANRELPGRWRVTWIEDRQREILAALPADEAVRFVAATRQVDLDPAVAARLAAEAKTTPRALLQAELREGTITEADAPDRSLPDQFAGRSPTRRRALAVAALVSDDRSVDVALACAVDPDIEGALAAELDDGGIIRRDSGAATFADRAWKDIAYDALDPLERRRLHGRVVEILDRRIDVEPAAAVLGTLALRLAAHARRSELTASPRTRAVRALTRAAEVAEPLDVIRAIDLYGDALAMTTDDRERIGMLMERARLRWAATDWDGAERDLADVVSATESNPDAVLVAEALLLAAQLTWDPTRVGGSLAQRLEEVLHRLPAGERLLRARINACLAGGLYQDGATAGTVDGPALATAAIRELDSLATAPEPSTEAEVLWWARKGLLDVASPDEVAALTARLRDASRHSSHHLGNATLAGIVDDLTLGDVARARRHSHEYTAIARSTSSPLQRYVAATLAGLWALYEGRQVDVERATSEAEEIGGAFGGVTVTQVVEGQRILLARDRGDFRRDPGLVAVVEQLTPVDGPIPIWAAASAWLRAEIGDGATALERLDDIAAGTRDLTDVPRGPHRLPLLAFVAEALEQIDAEALTDRARCLAQRAYDALTAHPARGVLLGWPVAYLGPKEHYLGLAAAARGDDERALAHLRTARRQSATTTPINLRAQVVIARALARQGQRDAAHRIARRCAGRAESIDLQGVHADALEVIATR